MRRHFRVDDIIKDDKGILLPCTACRPAPSRHGRGRTAPAGKGRRLPPDRQTPDSPQTHYLGKGTEQTEIISVVRERHRREREGNFGIFQAGPFFLRSVWVQTFNKDNEQLKSPQY